MKNLFIKISESPNREIFNYRYTYVAGILLQYFSTDPSEPSNEPRSRDRGDRRFDRITLSGERGRFVTIRFVRPALLRNTALSHSLTVMKARLSGFLLQPDKTRFFSQLNDRERTRQNLCSSVGEKN